MPLVEVRQFFDVVKSVYNYFSCSYRRWHLLMSQPQCSGFPKSAMTLTLFKLRQQNFVTTVNAKIALVVANHALCEDRASGSKPRTLKSLPKTRWSARKDVSLACQLWKCGGKLGTSY